MFIDRFPQIGEKYVFIFIIFFFTQKVVIINCGCPRTKRKREIYSIVPRPPFSPRTTDSWNDRYRRRVKRQRFILRKIFRSRGVTNSRVIYITARVQPDDGRDNLLRHALAR